MQQYVRHEEEPLILQIGTKDLSKLPPLYRGSDNMVPLRNEFYCAQELGKSRGLSLNSDDMGLIKKYGLAKQISYLPDGLGVAQRGSDSTHFEIIPLEVARVSADELAIRVQAGEKFVNNVTIDNRDAVLQGQKFDGREFKDCFIDHSFKNCSLRNTVFKSCNLKTVVFEGCDMTGACIDGSSIEAMEVRHCILDGFVFGTNYAYGCTLKDYSRLKTPTGFSF